MNVRIKVLPVTTAMAACTLLLTPNAAAQAWPQRPIRLIMPFPPGGATDANARALAKEMEGPLGQSIIVDNRGGANGIIGSDLVAKAAPDGYTMMHISAAFAITPSTYKKLPFDPIRDFTPFTNPIVGNGALLIVHPSVPARSVNELIAVAKKQQLIFSSPGIGNVLHLINEAFNSRAGIRMLHVPYKGAGPALIALLGAEAQVMIVPPLTATVYVKADRLRALAYSGAKRLDTLPEIPTIGEAALPGFHIDTGWHAWFAPAGTPVAIINRIHLEIQRGLKDPKLRDYFTAGGYVPAGNSPTEFRATFLADLKRYGEIVRAANIEPQ